MSGVWMRGSNNVFADGVVTSNANNLDVAIHVEGHSNFVRNLRTINSLACVQVGEEFTNGCTIDGIWPTQYTQPAAVLLNTVGTGKNVNIIPRNNTGYTSLIDTREVEGLRIVQPSTELVLSTNSIVNNTTTPVDVSNDLRYYVAPGEKFRFQATFFFTGTGTSDIKFTFQGPASPTSVIWGVPDSIKWDTSAATATSIPDTSYSTPENFSASASLRAVTFIGYVANGVNAGWFRPQFAQNLAEVADTTVVAGSTLSIIPVIY
jgi:hypothetical protein